MSECFGDANDKKGGAAGEFLTMQQKVSKTNKFSKRVSAQMYFCGVFLILLFGDQIRKAPNEMEAFASIYTNVASVSPLLAADVKMSQSPTATPSGSPRPELSSPPLDQTCIVRALSIVSTFEY